MRNNKADNKVVLDFDLQHLATLLFWVLRGDGCLCMELGFCLGDLRKVRESCCACRFVALRGLSLCSETRMQSVALSASELRGLSALI